jgi:four helix bundle protein
MKYLQLKDVDCYVISFHLSNDIWNIVLRWDYLARDVVGKQFASAADSISANIAEGFGRYTKKDKAKFYRYSLGSVWECRDWNEKARRRKLITNEQYHHIFTELNKLPKEIYSLINYTNNKLTL